jgi:hypothetical protein
MLVVVFMAVTLLLIANAGSSWASTPESQTPGFFVRIPADQVETAVRLGLNPLVAVDYGSFQWLELNQADYDRLVASDVTFTAEPEAGQVQVVAYTFDPVAAGEPALTAEQRAITSGPALRLVQFVGPANDTWLEAMKTAGLPILQYYPSNAFLTWATEAQVASFANREYVRWQGIIHPAYKPDPALAKMSGLIQNVDVMFYNDGDMQATLDAITALGGNILLSYPSQPDKAFYDVVVELPADKVTAVAQLNTVLWLGHLSPDPIKDDEMASQIVAGNHPAGVPVVGYNAHLTELGFDGTGVIWSITDSGVDYDHPDLGPRIVGGYNYAGCTTPNPGDASDDGHGTHVAGIVGGDATAGFADANGFLYGLGVAPAYSIFAQNPICNAGTSWPPAGGWQEMTKRAVLGNAIGSNNSWTTGEGTAHGYQASERTHDIAVLDANFDTTTVAEPFILVFSAGNSGPGAGTLTAPKEGKNLIITASSQNYRVASNINTISSFSSRGPAVDGRWVPTITAPGETIASTRFTGGAGSCTTAITGTNGMYAFCSGTSMASPQASGAVVLATEWWRSFNSGADPSPAMAKALLVNTAVDMGTADIPNANEGWGRINVTNIISPTALVVYQDQEFVFNNTGEQYVLTVGVPDPSQPLKVTVAWSDAPGAAGANPALVNNLNLTVQNGANTYLGNVFSGGWSATGGTADNRNNIENVFIQNPQGSATIIIDAANIAGDAILYNGDPTDQHFALICSNCSLFPDFSLSAAPSALNVCAPADAEYNVEVGSVMGFTDVVTLSASGHPAGTSASFSANGQPAPYSSILTIGNTGAAAAGSYAINIVGVAPTSTHTTTVQLNLFSGAPGAASLLTPANGATNVPASPTFTWSDAGATSYLLEVATDIGFSNIVYSATVNGTSHTAGATLNTSSSYFWRVRGNNACGDGSYSATYFFTTVAAPGDCGPGTVANVLYDYGFESGASGWTSGGTGNTWALVTTNPHSGANHYRGLGSSSVSDQRLISPAVALPAGENPVVLKFWHTPNLEASGTTACFDGGILEVSTNGGTTWTQVPNASLLAGGYRGAISSSYSNPLAGLQGWCGSSAYINTIADLSAYAGQTAQFRMRLGTDTSVSAPGWDVDDVMVQSCVPAADASISLTKTVGVDPDVYPTTTAITVTRGTAVTYFFEVENTGAMTMSLHTLTDSHLGMVLGPDFAHDLAPGATVMVTATAVLTTTVTNEALWVATDGGASTAVASPARP